MNRRTFLKASLLFTAALSLNPASIVRAAEEEIVYPEGRLKLYNIHNRERLDVTFRDRAGNYDLAAIQTISWLMRCQYDNTAAEIDPRTIEIINYVDKSFGEGGREVHVISGYRSPAYNQLLRSEGHGAAAKSLHMEGKAVDISIPGIPLHDVRQAALNIGAGGVGYYPHSSFVHVDSGKVRTW